MREILFRGKIRGIDKWIEGTGVFNDGTNTWISFNEPNHAITYGIKHHIVLPETVGQFTGFTDKNGKRIFEGDIIRKTNRGRNPQIFIANIRTDFRVNEEVYYGPCERFIESCEYEIIGNIHDNPELLKGGEG